MIETFVASHWITIFPGKIILTHLHRRPVRVHEPEGGDVGAAVLELLHVHQVEVQAGDQEVVVGGHHAHVLGLPQHGDHVLDVTVEHDVDLSRLFHLAQYPPARVKCVSDYHHTRFFGSLNSTHLFSSLFLKLSLFITIFTSAFVVDVISSWSLMRPWLSW